MPTAEILLKKAREDAKTFFEKKAKTQEGKKNLIITLQIEMKR